MKDYRDMLVKNEYEMQILLDIAVLILSTIFLILGNENSDAYFMITIILIILSLFCGIHAHRQAIININNDDYKENITVFLTVLFNYLYVAMFIAGMIINTL